MDSALPAAVVATILSRLNEVSLTYDLLRPLPPPNPSLRSLRLDCAKLEDAAISCLARPSLHELLLLNCENISGRLLRELGATCRDLRVLSLNSLAERRGLPISFFDLEELLNGCSQLESLSLALDFSMFDDSNFSHVWASASEGLSSVEIGYIPITMLLELLTAAMESQQCVNHVKALAFFSSLQKLCLSVDFITDHLIASISTALSSLTHLDLQDAPIIEPTSSSDLTNAGLQKINPNDTGFSAIIHSCSGLHKLRVSHGSQLTDLVFHDIIATSLCLTHVSLRWCNLLTDVGIERLSFNEDLNVLDLRDCRSLGDEAVRALSCLPKL